MLNAGGLVVQLESEEEAPAAAAGAAGSGATRRRYSIMPGGAAAGRGASPASYQKPAALPSTAQETARQLAARRATLIALSDRDTIDMMKDGSKFYRYFLKEGTNQAGKEIVTVWFAENAFWWALPMLGKQQRANATLPLNQLTDVFLGTWNRTQKRKRKKRQEKQAKQKLTDRPSFFLFVLCF